MSQSIEKRPRGRPSSLDLTRLLEGEIAWIGLFCRLRDGSPETIEYRYGSSGIFVKTMGDQCQMYVDLGGETREVGGREQLTASFPREKPLTLRQPKIIESAEQMKSWRDKAQAFEDEFNRVTMGNKPQEYLSPAVSHGRHIWEALKRARTATQIRRAYSPSKILLPISVGFFCGGVF